MTLNRLKTLKFVVFIPILITLFMMIGCMDKDIKKIDDFEEWKIKAEQSKAYTPLDQAEIERQEVRKKKKELTKIKKEEEKLLAKKKVKPERPLPRVKVSMKMNEVAVDVVIRTLAKVAGVNIIISKNVTGSTGLNIENVPWDQVFLSVLKTFGYSYEWVGDIIRVVSVTDITNDVALMEAQQTITAKKREHALNLLTINSKVAELEPLETVIIPILYIGIEDLEPLRDNLLTLLQPGGESTAITGGSDGEDITSESLSRGGILIDKHTHSLLVQATASQLEMIIPIVQKLDEPVPQILIEAQIVEATKETARELGVQWGGLGFNQSNGRNNWLGGPMGSFADSLIGNNGVPVTHVPDSIGNISNFPVDSIAGDGGQGLNLGMMFENPGQFMLTVQLQALQKDGKLNILSSPSITTLNNQKATIESGKEVPFQTVEDGDIKIEFKPAVIKLEVTPHVISDSIVKLEIITNKDELDWSRTVNGNPTIIKKLAETGVVLFDGQTTVIAGLSKSTSSDGDNGIPWLKDIPILGNLFKNTKKSSDMEELLIFITPRILDVKNFQEVQEQRTLAKEAAQRRFDEINKIKQEKLVETTKTEKSGTNSSDTK